MRCTKRKCKGHKTYYSCQIPKIFIVKSLHAFLIFLCLSFKKLTTIATNGNAKTAKPIATIKNFTISITFINLTLKLNVYFKLLQAFKKAIILNNFESRRIF